MKNNFFIANIVSILVAISVSLFFSSNAQAIPAFARETGQECSMCHVGSFGPQLTAYGRNFKLYAYQAGDGVKNPLQGFSAMVVGGYENTKSDLRKGTELTDKQARYDTNNNITMDQASIFYGGQLFTNFGMLAQVTYNNATEQVTWDNSDVRYANNMDLAGKPLVYGVTVNNNPTVQDLWQTTPAWTFPYTISAFQQSPTASPYITQMGLSVGGAGLYGMWNDLVYAELTGYTTIPDNGQRAVGITGSPQSDHLSSIAPYWRLAVQHDFGSHYVEVGTYGIYADRYPSNISDYGHDNFLDYALDATYQFTTNDGKHTVSVYGSALREHQDLASTFASSGSANPNNTLTNLHANASYSYENTYGLTFGPFSTTGSADSVLYGNQANNKPDTTGWTIQADYTPFGREGAFAYPNVNVRYFIQYTAYNKFNGLSNNYDGTGRNASDNNIFFTGLWFAF